MSEKSKILQCHSPVVNLSPLNKLSPKSCWETLCSKCPVCEIVSAQSCAICKGARRCIQTKIDIYHLFKGIATAHQLETSDNSYQVCHEVTNAQIVV